MSVNEVDRADRSPVDTLAALADKLPSEEDVAAYRKRGYYISEVVLEEQLIDAARAGAARVYAVDFDEPRAPIPAECMPNGTYTGLRKHDYARLLNRDLERLVLHPIIGAIAARLTGSPSIRLWHDQLLYKPPDTPGTPTNVGWHTDRSYWQCCTSENMLTAWVPFHDCDAEMGTVTMVEGSHLWPAPEVSNFFDNDLDGAERRLREAGHELNKIPMELRKGQISFHHVKTLHGSGPNCTDRPRQSVAVHLQDEANDYRVYQRPDGRQADHPNNRLADYVDGRPDYTDRRYFPVLWPPTR